MAELPSTDVAVIGGGAAGLMAAITAARIGEGDVRVTCFDGAKKLGAKILVSGGGRCNVTHYRVNQQDFAGSNPNHIKRVLSAFTVKDAVLFFDELGVRLKREETGKLFPESNKAQTVLDALLHAAEAAWVTILPEHRVESVTPNERGFLIETARGRWQAKRVIIATGGKSLPRTGSDGQGYGLAQTLGHTIEPPFPALVPLVLPKDHWLRGQSGVAIDVELQIALPSGKILHRCQGAMLCTHFGISGPAVLDISRHWLALKQEHPDARLQANLAPGVNPQAVDVELSEAVHHQATRPVSMALRKWLPQRFAEALLEFEVDVAPRVRHADLSRDIRRRVVAGVTALPLPVERDRGFLFAEVTAGGVPLAEIDTKNMASKQTDGLHLCGEIVDVDGRIGGFNFQWAWASGYIAGKAAAEGVKAST